MSTSFSPKAINAFLNFSNFFWSSSCLFLILDNQLLCARLLAHEANNRVLLRFFFSTEVSSTLSLKKLAIFEDFVESSSEQYYFLITFFIIIYCFIYLWKWSLESNFLFLLAFINLLIIFQCDFMSHEGSKQFVKPHFCETFCLFSRGHFWAPTSTWESLLPFPH